MQLSFPFPQDRDDRFDTFVVDEKNRETAALCRRFADNDESVKGGKKSLILFGAPSSGKTHLMAAMGRQVTQAGGEAHYLDCGDLAMRVLTAETYEELKKGLLKYDKATFLAIDRLEKVKNSSEAQEQVFHLYNTVTEAGGRFAGAISAPPPKWAFEDYLQTRLLWGQVVELAPVGDEAMVDVLIKTGKDFGLTLPAESARWLMTRLSRDPKSLIAVLQKIDRYSLSVKRKISVSLIKEALEK